MEPRGRGPSRRPHLSDRSGTASARYAYLCSDTIEERIEEILFEKRTIFADIIDAVEMGMLRRLDLDVLLSAVRQKSSSSH